LPPQVESDYNKPHPGSGCQEIGETDPYYKNRANYEVRSEVQIRYQRHGGKCIRGRVLIYWHRHWLFHHLEFLLLNIFQPRFTD